MKPDYDVIIIGSGPAGSIAAYYLAKEKFKVLMLEKCGLPRYKTCGGGVVARIFNSLPFDLTPVVDKFISTAEICNNKADLHFYKRNETPVIAMCMRDKLDYFLLNKAVEAGAEVLTNEEVKDIILNKNYCKVVSKNISFKTKMIIAADGAAGITAKKGGWKDNRYTVPALEYEVYLDDSEYSKYSASARFDFDIIPNGYGWIFPKLDHLSIGAASFRKNNKKKLKFFMENYMKKLSFKSIKKIDAHGFFIPLTFRNVLAKNKILLTGDAAGFADPLTGEGITYAVKSGELAARAIIEAGLNSEKSAKNYNIFIKNLILPELKAAKYLSKIFYGNQFLQTFILKNYGEKFCQIMLDIISGKKTYLSLLKNPYNYLKLFKFYKPRTSEIKQNFSLNP